MRLLLAILMLALCGCETTRHQHRRHDGRKQTVRHKQIYIVMDDAGLAVDEVKPFMQVPIPMTIAVLPFQKETGAVCDFILRHPGKEVILHQPMEAYDGEKNPGINAIYNTTDPREVPGILDASFKSVRGAVGMNNHMGSRVTENDQLLSEVMNYCRQNGYFFLDSKTAYNSRAVPAGHRHGMHIEQRDVFLDIDRDRESVRKMWAMAVAHAREHGHAVVIGHVWCEEAAIAIRDSYEMLMKQGYTFHKLSELYE
jgi:polysaccharide deacetylase 2 family uncharacterized protein YibQ